MSAYAEAQYTIDELTKVVKSTGWKLQPPTNIVATNFDEAVKLTWDDPENVEMNGALVCEWAGTVVVRKEGSAPTSPTDGTVVTTETMRNQYKSVPLVDNGLTNGTTYYYGIFPFTTLEQYTTSAKVAFTPSPIEVATPKIVSVRGQDKSVKIELDYKFDSASMVKIVYKKGSAPTNEKDGTVKQAITTNEVEISGLTNLTEYYFVAYAYTNKRVSSASNVVSATPRAYIAYAMHIQGGESNTEAVVTYPAGYDNSNFADTAYVNLATGVPHLGDWDGAWFFPRSCMLKYDGTVDYYLDENDETKKADGSKSDVANMSYGGNAMMEWGQEGNILYWKCVPDSNGNGETFVIANAQLDSDMKPWNHINCKGLVASHFYTPKYFGSSGSSKLRSISGGSNYVSQTGTTELSMAKANNPGSDEIWNTEVYADWQLINHLLIMMCKSTNLQAKWGYGRCASGNSSAIGQGTMNGKGMFYGRNDQTSGVKIFGMENWWGNIWRRIAGYINDRGTVKVKMCYGKEDGSTVDKYNTDGSGYVTQGTVSGTSGGYISAMNFKKQGMTPKIVSGSDNTYFPDGCWFNNNQNNYARVGGAWDHGLRGGGLCSSLHAAVSVSGATVGAALSCKPLT